MSTALETLKARTSANNFDATKTLTDAQIKELITYACEAPSSFNIQHWRFIAVRDKAAKDRLKAVSYGQAKVSDAAVTFIILGDLHGHEKLSLAFEPMLKKGMMDQKTLDGMVGMANGFYQNNPQNQRDEAIRSGSLAAMNLMTAATAMGYASGAMIGFDPAGVKKEFGISDQYVPVMLIAVGPAAPGNWPRKPRFTTDQVLGIDKMTKF